VRRGSAAAPSTTTLGSAFTRNRRSSAGHMPSRARCRMSSRSSRRR
jgi:hypothetical protein